MLLYIAHSGLLNTPHSLSFSLCLLSPSQPTRTLNTHTSTGNTARTFHPQITPFHFSGKKNNPKFIPQLNSRTCQYRNVSSSCRIFGLSNKKDLSDPLADLANLRLQTNPSKKPKRCHWAYARIKPKP